MSRNNKVSKGLEDLSELRKELATLPLDLPELSLEKIETGGLEALNERAREIDEKAKQVESWVGKVLTYQEKIDALPRTQRELLADTSGTDFKEAEERLDRFLREEPIKQFRRAAWLGVLEHEFHREPDGVNAVRGLCEKLVKQNILVPSNGNYHLKVFEMAFCIPAESFFEEDEIGRVRMALGKLLKTASRKEQSLWQQNSKTLEEQTTITVVDFLRGNAGQICLRVPAEKNIKTDKWRPGGTLLVKSDGSRIFPLLAVGRIEGVVERMKRDKIFLLLKFLCDQRPPVLFFENMTEDKEREKVDEIRILYYLLRRAISAEQMKEMIDAARKELSEKPDLISSQEFFEEGKDGICFAEYEGAWKSLDGSTITHLFFLPKREKGLIGLCEIPKHLSGFFDKCKDREFEEGQRFEGVAQPLQAVLRAIFGQVVKASAIAANGKQ